MPRTRTALAAIAALLFTTAAAADPSKDDVARADALFRAAQALMQAGSVTEACAKFGESYALDPAPGALLNLAACHEKDTKLGSAAREYEQLVDLMSKGKTRDDHERLKFASDALARLEPRLTRAAFDVSALPPGYTLKLDGAVVAAADLTKARPIDVGDHAVEVSTPGKPAKTSPWKVLPQPGTQTFKAELPDDSPPALVPLVAPPPVTTAPPLKVETIPTTKGDWRRPAGFVLGGIGIVGIGVGTYFGLDTFKKRDARDPHCVGTFCDAEGISLDDKAHTSATISTIAFVAGFAALGAGGYFLLTARAPRKTAGWAVFPTLGGLSVKGGF